MVREWWDAERSSRGGRPPVVERGTDQNGGSSELPPDPEEAHGSWPPAGAPPWLPPWWPPQPPPPCWAPPPLLEAHGSSPPPDWKPWPPPERLVLLTLAVALRRLGPPSSTPLSQPRPFRPSGVPYEGALGPPCQLPRMPGASDSAAFWAACRHTEQLRNRVSW